MSLTYTYRYQESALNFRGGITKTENTSKKCVSAYRFGFNGKEGDDETYGDGNAYDFGNRIYDSRLGRWLSLDPLMKKYPFESHYAMVSNNPIFYLDGDGRFKINPTEAKKYPQLANFIRNEVHSYVLNNTELAKTIMDWTGATREQFDRVFKHGENSVSVGESDFQWPTGAIAETYNEGSIDGNGVRQTVVGIDKDFLKTMENRLKNGSEKEKQGAKLAMAILLVHEGMHALLAETGASDISKDDEVGNDIGKQVENFIYGGLIMPSGDEIPANGYKSKEDFHKAIWKKIDKLAECVKPSLIPTQSPAGGKKAPQPPKPQPNAPKAKKRTGQ